MKSVFDRIFRRQRQQDGDLDETHDVTVSMPEDEDVWNTGFPLVPDDYHLQHVGKTLQGNGYWIDIQLAVEKDGTRDFVAAYIFDKEGCLISSEVVDQGMRTGAPVQTTEEIIGKLKKKIAAKDTSEILVKPFSTSFYGHTFGLVAREADESKDATAETLIDAMPGHTLMFYGPWSLCNYDT